MSPLRQHAKAIFQTQQVFRGDVGTQCPVIDICRYSTRSTVVQEQSLHGNDLVTFAEQLSPTRDEQQASSSLKFVGIEGDVDGPLHISRQTFLGVFERFKLEPYILYLIKHEIHGFHHFHPQQGQDTSSFYMSTAAYRLMWTFDARTSATRAVLIVMRFLPRGRTETIRNFLHMLALHQELIMDPMLVALVGGIEVMQYVDRYIREQLDHIRSVEATTGHTRRQAQIRKGRVDIDELTNMSKTMGIVLVGTADIKRHLQVIGTMVSSIVGKEQCEACDTDLTSSSFQSARALTKETVSLLLPQLKSAGLCTDYLQERAKNQLTVLFNLIGREDAAASIQLAAAAKRDSSSMKTVAIMTMAFLPATFFAALFAVPSLQWDAASVVTDRFWVYWAFTLPATLLVFGVWFLVTSRDFVLAKLQKAAAALRFSESEKTACDGAPFHKGV